ncbi:hypothetical protein [Labedaea rhizosphaerae]|uniref:Circularly permuted ATP-grasp superfamily protein n=1 Tax=Labedaea rhizosphaerae TaxID=598644 RepID=A0A4R6SA57_LABRH|nr:hypothetical protein [Labedaea rhizosphaerae]TDP96800.1 hypothetical protein EV186_104788 [Labedaea rhizosphaerae]
MNATEDFTRRCAAGDTELLHAMATAAGYLPPVFREFREEGLLPRPLFVPRAAVTDFADGLRALFDLLVELPRRVFDGDLERYCKAAGMDADRARQVHRFADRAPTLFGRADAYRVGGRFRLLELNVCSAVGGIDSAHIPPALLRVPAFRAFAEAHGLGFTDSGRMLADALRAAAAAGDPTVAFVCPDGEWPGHQGHLESYAEVLAGFGLRAVTGEISAVRDRGGRLELGGERVDVIVRFLSDAELIAASGPGSAGETILRAHEEGRVVLWTGLENQRVNNKGALALLADDAVREALTGAEARLVDDVLPWTRRLADTETTVGGEPVGLLEHCRAERESLLLKPSFGHGGRGLVIGWQTDDATWARCLADGVRDAWIVQERVLPDPEPVVDPATGVVVPWSPVWGVFLTPAGYAGLHVRAVPADSPDPVIRRMAAGARTTSAFHYPARHDELAS